MRLTQCALILFLSCCLNNCGFIKPIYNHAPEAISWWLDDYFDFNQSQIAVLNPKLRQLHDWHRQNQLPSYIGMLQDIKSSLVQEQISASEVCGTINRIKMSFNDLQLESIPIIIEIAPLLSNKQLKYFQGKLEKRALKWKSEWLQDSSEEQIEVRFEKTEDFAEKVYGVLNDSQRALLKQNLKNTPIRPQLTYAEILRRNGDIYQVIRALQNQTLSQERKSQLIKEGFDRLQNSSNPIYQAYADQVEQRTCEIVADLHISTDAKQKQHAKDWLDDYILQLSGLSVK